MSIVFFTIPLALILAIVFLLAFIIAVKIGQLDDLKTPSYKMLLEDEKVLEKEIKNDK